MAGPQSIREAVRRGDVACPLCPSAPNALCDYHEGYAAALAATPEAKTVTEYQARQLSNGFIGVAATRAQIDLVLHHGGWRIEAQRTRTTYADHVTDWVPVVSEEASQ